MFFVCVFAEKSLEESQKEREELKKTLIRKVRPRLNLFLTSSVAPSNLRDVTLSAELPADR